MTICHFDKGLFKTVTVPEKDARKHMKEKNKSYCGVCIEDRFTRESVINSKNLPRQEGLEVQDDYEVEYNVTYLKAGFVSLAAAYQIINNVTCSAGAIKIQFSNPLQQSALPSMFPIGSLLIVDGILYGINCTVKEEFSTDSLSQSGFLIIQGSRISEGGKTVTVNGIPASFMHIFQEQNMTYHSVDTPDRRLVEGSAGAEGGGSISVPPISAQLSCKVRVMARFLELKSYWRLLDEGSFWWRFDPYIDFLYEFAYRIDMDLDAKFSFAEKLGGSSTVDKEIDVGINFVIPGAGYALPTAVTGFLNKLLPSHIKLVAQAGAIVEVPIALNAAWAAKVGLQFGLASSLSSGEKSVALGISGGPSNLVSRFDVKKDEPFNMTSELKPPKSTGQVEGNVFGGLKPKLKLECLGKF